MLQKSNNDLQRVAVCGSGPIVSHLYRNADGAYSFNLYRMNDDRSVSQSLDADDLRDLVKLCQVLASAICDDGWLSSQERERLLDLNDQLDALTASWKESIVQDGIGGCK